MEPELLAKMLGLVTMLGAKPKLMGPELNLYMRGLSFVEKQFELYNLALEQGIDELNRGPTGDNGEDLSTQIHPPNNYDPFL